MSISALFGFLTRWEMLLHTISHWVSAGQGWMGSRSHRWRSHGV